MNINENQNQSLMQDCKVCVWNVHVLHIRGFSSSIGCYVYAASYYVCLWTMS